WSCLTKNRPATEPSSRRSSSSWRPNRLPCPQPKHRSWWRRAMAGGTLLFPPVTIPDALRQLLTAPGPSGYETAPAAAWRAAAEGFAAEVRADVVGSSVARVAGTGDGPRLAVVGHI